MSAPCYCILIRKISRRLTARYDAALEPFGVSLAQFSLLRNIRRQGLVSVTHLAEIVDLDRSTAGRNCKLLLRAGLIEPAKADDQREAAYRLSSKGQDLLEEADPVWEGVQKELGSNIDASQLAALERLLEIV